MAEEKIIDAGKQPDKPQDKFADERLTDDELDNVAGGSGGKIYESFVSHYEDSHKNTGKMKVN